MKEAEEFMKEAQKMPKLFEKQSKKEKKTLAFERDEDRLRLSDCEDQLREWAKDLVDGKLREDLKALNSKT